MVTKAQDKKEEISFIVLGCGAFSLALILVDIFVAKWSKMEAWVIIPVILLHIGTLYSWIKAINTWNDPNKNYWRKWVIGLAILALLIILFHNAGWVENARFWDKTAAS
jgi:hypothetical protein